MTKVALIGMGKMGKSIDALAGDRDCEIVARLDHEETKTGISKGALNGAAVAIEFTTPEAAPRNIRALLDAGVPTIVGTTGWYDALPEISRLAKERKGALLTATNFSIGVNAFEEVLAKAAELLAKSGSFDAQMVETHHAAKKDAPSGTAITLETAAGAAWGKKIPIISIRTGSVPGTHELIFDAPFETIRLEHTARDRRVFAEGALMAAKWLVGKQGVYTMKDVIHANS